MSYEMRSGSPIHDLPGFDEWPRFALERNWTDGLPVYPPTPESVDVFLESWGVDPSGAVGSVPPSGRLANNTAVAANCIMAGCLPEYASVVTAALAAMLEPRFNLQGVQTTTHSCEPLTIISGPIVQELGFATEECVFAGGGRHANVAVGRAIRLILWNIGGGLPGRPARKTHGHPGRFSFLIPEDTSGLSWQPWHTERGVSAKDSAVTVFACESPHSIVVSQGTDLSPEQVLDRAADHMAALGSNNITTQGEQLLVIGPFFAQILDRAGWGRARVQQYLFEKAQRPLATVRPLGSARPDTSPRYWWDWLPEAVDQSIDESMVPSVDAPEAVHIVVSGARGGHFMSVCPGWGKFGGFAVTRAI